MDERAARISLAIEKSGLSYPELEKITGVSKSSLQRYATGGTKKIPIECIEKIAEATGTDARYLMGWDSEPISTAIHMLNPATSTDFQPVNFWGKVSAGVGAYADGVPIKTMAADSCRHTFASMCAAAGMQPEQLQKIIGHASYQTTADIYIHNDLDTLRQAMSKLKR